MTYNKSYLKFEFHNLSSKARMMRLGKIRLTLILLIVFLCGACPGYSADKIILGGYSKPPYMLEPGAKPGFCVEIFQEAAKGAGYATSYQLFPHKRMHLLFEGGKIDAEPCCSPAWRKRYERISVYSNPYFQSENIVLTTSETGIDKTEDITDFYGRTIGTILGYYIEDGFENAFIENKMIRDDVKDQALNLKKLSLNRVDAIIVDRATGFYLINQAGMNRSDFKVVYVFKSKSDLSFRFHVSKQHAVTSINAVLNDMKADGSIGKLIRKYSFD